MGACLWTRGRKLPASSTRRRTRTSRRSALKAHGRSIGMQTLRRRCTRKQRKLAYRLSPQTSQTCALATKPQANLHSARDACHDRARKNLIVQRLRDGQQKKTKQARATVAAARASNTKLKLGQLTQEGVPKSCGTKSILQTLGSLSTTTKANLEKAIGDRVCGKFGWRTLKSKMSKIPKVDMPHCGGAQSLQVRPLWFRWAGVARCP